MKYLVAALTLTAWTWTQDNGTQAYTDDPDRVPARYAEQAEKVELGVWADYPKLSVVVHSEAEED
jgi:hypothetical protein